MVDSVAQEDCNLSSLPDCDLLAGANFAFEDEEDIATHNSNSGSESASDSDSATSNSGNESLSDANGVGGKRKRRGKKGGDV